MSISSALSNALSGLTASAANAQVVSANVANALTPGYAPRSISLSARGGGRAGGVMIQGIVRDVDAGLLSARRGADARLANAQVGAGFLSGIERLVGPPGGTASLSGRLAALEADLVTAASKPEEESRLRAVSQQAGGLAAAIRDMSRGIQQLRGDAEARIERAVADANTRLREIHTLNARIADASNKGHPTAAFEDQRRVVLDGLAELVPIRLTTRDNGTVAVYSTGGATLLDGRPAEFSFTAGNIVMPHMTIGNGLLNGLTLNGRAIPPSGAESPIEGGRIAGLFELRDRLAPDAQTRLDAVARDLVARFQDPAIDPTRPPGAPGLFTDGGAAFVAANETGLALRLALNPLVDPAAGGAVWRLRDGLGAGAPTDPGNAALLHDLSAALSRPGALASGDLGASERSLSGHLATFMSFIGQDRLSLDRAVSFATAQQAGLLETEQGMGVDTDAEMQKLLLVEQAYTANARVVTVIGDLIDTLMGI